MAIKQEKTKKIILAAARQMFARFGLEKTSIDEIAKTAKVAKGTIYSYFENKDHIYLAVLQSEADEMLQSIVHALSKVSSPIDKLRMLILVKFQCLEQSPNFRNLDRNKLIQCLPYADEVWKKYLEKEFKLVKSILSAGVENGIFVIDNISLVTKTIIYALKGFEIHLLIDEDSEKQIKNTEHYINKILDMLFFGIVKKKKGLRTALL